MAYNWMPYVFWTFFWVGLIIAMAWLFGDAVDEREGLRKVVQVVLAALIAAFVLGNLWAAFLHAENCDDHYDNAPGCPGYEEEEELGWAEALGLP